MGEFATLANTVYVMDNILDDDESHYALKLVFLARNPAPSDVKAVIQRSLYKDRVTFLVGSGLSRFDFNRCQLRHASAVYIMPNRNAPDALEEDEQNTLRSWAAEKYFIMLLVVFYP
jgi:hypothetical protein